MLRTSTSSSSSSSQVILQIKSIEKPLKITRVFLSSPLLQLGWSSLQLLGAARSSWRRKMTIRIHQRIWWLPDVHRFPTKPCWKKVGDRSSPTVFSCYTPLKMIGCYTNSAKNRSITYGTDALLGCIRSIRELGSLAEVYPVYSWFRRLNRRG